jgi:hypothetical protein
MAKRGFMIGTPSMTYVATSRNLTPRLTKGFPEVSRRDGYAKHTSRPSGDVTSMCSGTHLPASVPVQPHLGRHLLG